TREPSPLPLHDALPISAVRRSLSARAGARTPLLRRDRPPARAIGKARRVHLRPRLQGRVRESHPRGDRALAFPGLPGRVRRVLMAVYLLDGGLRVPDSLTIYQSSTDKALGMSRFVFGRDRSGQVVDRGHLGPRAREFF